MLLFITIGCSENKETKVIDTDTFLNNLKKAPNFNISKENLPEWLVVKINEIEIINSRDICCIKIRIFQGEWEKQTVYFIVNSFSSCIFCDTYYEDGKKIEFPDDGGKKSNEFMTESHQWKIIYEFGEGYDL